MADPLKEELPETPSSEEDVLRKRLVNRIAIAAVMIVALLGGLAIIDALYVPPPAVPAPKMAAAPEEKTDVVATAETGDSEAEKNADQSVVGMQAEPEKTETPPPAAEAKLFKPLTIPAQTRPASLKPSLTTTAPRHEPAKELARIVPTVEALRHAPASKPLSRIDDAIRRFVVQVGVFNNLANAEELRAKIEAANIPVQIEARVQVGPFATKAEAEAARTKLTALGVDPGILTATRK